MQALLLGTETIQEFLAELAGLAIRAVGDGLSCGITLEPNGHPENRNIKLRAFAAQIVAGAGGQPPQPPSFGPAR